MKRSLLYSLTVLCTFSALLGCAPGLIYTDITLPLVRNMDKTPRAYEMVTLDTKQLREPITAVRVGGEWNSRAIGDAAKKNGLAQIYYADMRTLSVLLGLWKKQTVQVWGIKSEDQSGEKE